MRVLFVGNAEDDFLLIERLLVGVRTPTFVFAWARTPAEARDVLRGTRYDACLVAAAPGESAAVDLLPGGSPNGCTPPVVLLTEQSDDADLLALPAGAADRLTRDELSGPLLARSLRYAVEQRQADARQRRFASSARCILWDAEIVDRDGALVWDLKVADDEAAQRFFPIDLLSGESYALGWYRSRLDEDRVRTDRFGDEQVRAGRGYAQEFRCRRRSGEVRWLREDVQIEAAAPGHWRAVGACMDVTPLKQAEDALRSSEAQLRQAQKMEAVGRLAGGIAHDFNNMLAVINGYCELLTHYPELPNSVREALQPMRKAGERAAALTQQLLAFSRKELVTLEAVNLNEVVARAERLLCRLIGEDVEVRCRLDPRLGRIEGDPAQLDQVIMNLAVNARDAMPGGGRLTFETRNVELPEGDARLRGELRPGAYVLLKVTDTGCGIPAEVQPQIFEPFFTTKPEGCGTGLGLATVYGIARQHGGHVTFSSSQGAGTSFEVYLPGTQAPAPEGARHGTPGPAWGSETILLVEDEEMVRDMTRRVLENSGYSVLAAPRADAALQIIRERGGGIDLVLTDVVMPGGVSGRELAEQVLSEFPGTRVLFMSGYTNDTIVRHGIMISEAAFIQKPFTPALLTNKVRDVLDGTGTTRLLAARPPAKVASLNGA